MSTDLSNKNFVESAENGAFSWLFEAFRVRMRDTAKAVRMEAAWNTWPAIHRVAKALHESLITPADELAERNSCLEDMVERCAAFYPTEEHLQRAIEYGGRNDVALSIGGGLDDNNQNLHGITLDDVLSAYRERIGDSTVTQTQSHPEIS